MGSHMRSNSKPKLRSHTRSGQSSRQQHLLHSNAGRESINYPHGLGTTSVDSRRSRFQGSEGIPEGYSVPLIPLQPSLPPVSHVVGGAVLPVHPVHPEAPSSIASTSAPDAHATKDWTLGKLLTRWSVKQYTQSDKRGTSSLPSWKSSSSRAARKSKQVHSEGTIEVDGVVEIDEEEELTVLAATNAIITLSPHDEPAPIAVDVEQQREMLMAKRKTLAQEASGSLNDGSRTSFQVW